MTMICCLNFIKNARCSLDFHCSAPKQIMIAQKVKATFISESGFLIIDPFVN